MNFTQGLSNLGAIYSSAQSDAAAMEERRRLAEMNEMQMMAARQNMAQQAQQGAQAQQRFQAEQALVGRQRDAAQAVQGFLRGPPQNTPLPGATPMPSMGGGQPGGMPQSPMGGMASPMGPPPMARPPQGGMPQAPQGMPGITVPGGLPKGQMAAPAPPAQGGAGTPMPGAPQGFSGRVPIRQLAQHIMGQNPDMDPLTLIDAMQQYQALMAPEDKKQYDELRLALQEDNLDIKRQLAEVKAAGSGEDKTARRELENAARARGLDPTGKSTAELSAYVTKTPAPVKDTAGERRGKNAAADVRILADEIKKLVQKNPGAVGIWGKAAVTGGKIAGGSGQPASEDAKAAIRLRSKLTRLEQRLGVMDSAGGQGGTTFAKQWRETLGGNDWSQTPELLVEAISDFTGGAAPEADDDGWSISESK